MLIAVGLALVVLLTVATGYFVAQEFAYVSVDRNPAAAAGRRGRRRRARAPSTSRAALLHPLRRAVRHHRDRPAGRVRGRAAHRGGARRAARRHRPPVCGRLTIAVTLVLVFSTVLQMVVGELAPKNLAIARPIPLARSLSRSTLMYLAVAGPVIRLFDAASNRLLRAVGIEPVEELAPGATTEDLEHVIDESRKGGALDEDLSLLLERGLAFRALTAEQAMTPRVTRRHGAGHRAAGGRRRPARPAPHSRFPVVGRRTSTTSWASSAWPSCSRSRGPLGDDHGRAVVLRGGRRARVAAAAGRARAAPVQPPAAGRRRRRVRRLRRRAHPRGHRRGGRRRHLRRGRRARTRTAVGPGGHAYPLGPAAPGRGRVVDRHPPSAGSATTPRSADWSSAGWAGSPGPATPWSSRRSPTPRTSTTRRRRTGSRSASTRSSDTSPRS